MSTSQRDFIIGCLIGGIVGASAALLMPQELIKGINGVKTKTLKRLKASTSTKKSPSKKHKAKRRLKPKA